MLKSRIYQGLSIVIIAVFFFPATFNTGNAEFQPLISKHLSHTHRFKKLAVSEEVNVALNFAQMVSSGGYHTCALTDAGGIKCWGNNGHGQLGDGTIINRPIPIDVNNIGVDYSLLAAGDSHTCSLTTVGGVKCWGNNSDGQLGDGTASDRTNPVDVVGLSSGVIAIAAGGAHTCAVTTYGGVKCWGNNVVGQLGDGTTTNRYTPVDVIGLEISVSAIAVGSAHTCVLTTPGGLKCWGANYYGQLGDGTTTTRYTPTNVVGLSSEVAFFDTGSFHTCALTTSGGVKCWGENSYGQLGDGTIYDRHAPINVEGLSVGVTSIATGGYHSCAIMISGGVKCWGNNLLGQLGDGTIYGRYIPVDVVGLPRGAMTINPGSRHTCSLLSGGEVNCWGDNSFGQLGSGMLGYNSTYSSVRDLGSNITFLETGSGHTCAISSTGEIKCWGFNADGQLGDGTNINQPLPVNVIGVGDYTASLAAGGSHTCALTTSGGVKCWGNNRFGQLGDGSTSSSLLPINVFGLGENLRMITASGDSTCALTTSSGVKCWGNNWFGQLGDGTTTNRYTPVDVIGLSSGVAAIDNGPYHTCALLEGGSVKCWGRNDRGQLGDGTTTNRYTPVDIVGLQNDIVSISAGVDYTCALSSNGGIKCWGANYYGQLGDGSNLVRYTPVNVVGLESAAIALSTGGNTCAVMSSGGVSCWGLNSYGELGDGTTVNRNTPTDVLGLEIGIDSIKVGGVHSCAVTIDGEVECWGAKGGGQLGTGELGYSTIPQEVVWGKLWTLMYYLPGDNDLDWNIIQEYAYIRAAGNNDKVNVVVFIDGLNSPSRYIVFKPDGTDGPFIQGELNTGDPSTLDNFIQWSRTNYPAEHYALIISDHGHALGGVAYDESSVDDKITPIELKQVLSSYGKFDIIYMANCLMGNLEAEYEIRELVDYFVASESISWIPRHHDYAMAIDNATTAENLAINMAQTYVNELMHRVDQDYPSSISVVRLYRVEDVADKASALARVIRQNWFQTALSIWGVIDSDFLQRFDENINYEITSDDRLADLYHFAQLVSWLGYPELETAANDLMSSLNNYIIFNQAWGGTISDDDGNTHTWDHGNAYGVSIALPRNRMSFYTDEWLDFAGGTDWINWHSSELANTMDTTFEWGPMLVDLIKEFNLDGPDTPAPPDPIAPFPLHYEYLYLPLINNTD